MGFFEKFINFIKNLDINEEEYRRETLESRFEALPLNKGFKFLDLYDPFEHPLTITSQDVALFIEEKKNKGMVRFDKYVKCPNCSLDIHLFEENNRCSRCEHEFVADPETTFLIFMKIG